LTRSQQGNDRVNFKRPVDCAQKRFAGNHEPIIILENPNVGFRYSRIKPGTFSVSLW
jgi:hypothetical protein